MSLLVKKKKHAFFFNFLFIFLGGVGLVEEELGDCNTEFFFCESPLPKSSRGLVAVDVLFISPLCLFLN